MTHNNQVSNLVGNMSKTANHEILVYRLVEILMRLNRGEKLDPKQLCDDFHVNLRTIQRDLNERFAYLPLERKDGCYYLDPAFLGKLTHRDMERFASLAGIRGLFPALSDEFLRDIFDARIQSALLIKGHSYENLSGKEALFRRIEQAIVARNRLAFDYPSQRELKHYTAIDPYKLVNNKGIWYLAAKDGDKLKTFAFTKLDRVEVLSEQVFEHDPSIDAMLAEEDGVWLGEDKKEVVTCTRLFVPRKT